MKFKDISRKYISPFAKVSACVFVFCILLKFVAAVSPAFADFFNRYVASIFRAVTAYVTSVLPFSLGEAIIIMILPLSVLYIVYCAVRVSKSGKLPRHIFNLLGVIFALLSLFTVNFSIAYDCTPIEEKLDLDTESLTAADIYDACIIALDELDELSGEVARDKSGAAVMPYSFKEMSQRLNASYKNLYGEYSFLSPLYVAPKRIALSKPMTYTGIAGIYTFFTGEANVNTNFPDYAVTFTAAHEMAHQRGVAPEDEANFVAFLACYTSDDPYLRYCALTEVANYLSNSLYYADIELFYEASAHFPSATLNEYTLYTDGYAPYKDSAVGDVSEAINDTYLKTQGQAEGTASYGLVSELAAAYILKNHT